MQTKFVAASWIGMSEKQQSFLPIRPIHVLSRLWYAVNLLNNNCAIPSPKNVPCQIYANMQSRPVSAYFCRIFRDYMVRIFWKKCPRFSDMPRQCLYAGVADLADPTDSSTRNNLYSLLINVVTNASSSSSSSTNFIATQVLQNFRAADGGA